jgi:8-oxo-dGTP pyrophosphatase MutT (NUDIX family)/phosphohistidine phosphatase SixA
VSDKRSPDIRAAGAVVWRVQDGALELALVHRAHYDDWSLPKGKLENGESELAAAVREVGEEIGSVVAVSRRLTRVHYAVDAAKKTVAYWTMHHVGGEFATSNEVDALEWLSVAEARERVTYPLDRQVLDDFDQVPVAESVIVLVRHAKAGKRSEWKGKDALRPLESAGRAQAKKLARFLQPFAPDRVVSASPVRCVQTVSPFADEAGLDVGVDVAFTDEHFEASPASTSAALLALAVPHQVTVVCSQGKAIPGLIDLLAPTVPSSNTRKGAAWVLSFVDGAVVSADYYYDAAR